MKSETIYRQIFGSLNKYNDFPGDRSYYVLNDGYFCYKFIAENDDAAIETFKKYGCNAGTDGHGWLLRR